MSCILIEIHEGQIVRNLLENGLLDILTVAGHHVMLLTPGAKVPAFVERYKQAGVEFCDLNIISYEPSRAQKYENNFGKLLAKRNLHGLRRQIWNRVGVRLSNPQTDGLRDFVTEWRPDVIVCTHMSQTYGIQLAALAHELGIPTVGNLNSWDNAWKRLRYYTDVICCWSDTNRDELVNLNSVPYEDIRVIGAPAFDPYLADDADWTREQFCEQLGLNPARPILLFATLGQFSQQIDETNPIEVLLEEIDVRNIPNDPQVILRMHPWSRMAYFKPFMQRDDVVVSHYENYFPGLGWSPTRDEAILAGNLLKHADVVISPGSTMSIEPAIFDTPTVVPVFNEYMPEVFDAYFEQTWIKQHFSRLYKNDWVPIVRSREAMVASINQALDDPTWYAQGRAAIRENILGTLDGNATQRFANVIFEALR